MSLNGAFPGQEAAGRYPRYRAPAVDGQTLSIPPWKETESLLAGNRGAIHSRSAEIWGIPLAELARSGRAAVLDAAIHYTKQYADLELSANRDCPLVLTGHQPGFVHPGVWLKNFAAAQLAQQQGGVALSLVIDSDLCRSTSILVPSGSTAEPRAEHVPFDTGLPHTPWEERPVLDRETWKTFGARTKRTIAPFVPNPLVGDWWSQVIAARLDQGNLSSALSQARHLLELEWHGGSWEIPQSLVCQTAAFRQFSILLMAEAERFHAAHNQSLKEYRRVHRLRNHAQPVPDLAADDGWNEAPFWLWSTGDPTRRPVFVKHERGQLRLSDRADFDDALPWSQNGDTSSAVERLAAWELRGVKLRTRALVTTMFARLFLADVFIHGIGGAKYDQVTDAICERLFGFCPPPYVTLTGTLRLPIPHASDPPERERQLRQALRDLEFHPEKRGTELPTETNAQRRWEELAKQKRTLVATAKTLENAAERHRQIVAVNSAFGVWTAPARDRLQQELAALGERRHSQQILDSREYAFCLFPRDLLKSFLLDFSQRMP